MPQIADYAIVDDGLFTLPNNNDGINKDFPFTLPNDTVLVRGVLSYVVRPTSANAANYTITLNGTQILRDATLEDPQRRAVHEVVSGNDLNRGANTLVVERAGGSGSIQFSDIVLWFSETSDQSEKAGLTGPDASHLRAREVAGTTRGASYE